MTTDWSQDPEFKYLAVDRKKIMKEQTQAFDGKKACWVPDAQEGFLRAEIVSTKGEEITVKILSSNEVSFQLQKKTQISLMAYCHIRSYFYTSVLMLSD